MNYSLADHTIVIANNNFQTTIGNGSSLESITVSYANDNFSYTMAADGTGTLNKNKMRNGTITVSLQQTNPFVGVLTSIYEEMFTSSPTDVAQMTIKDSNGNINGTFTGCVVTKNPDYTANPESTTRDFVFLFKNGANI